MSWLGEIGAVFNDVVGARVMPDARYQRAAQVADKAQTQLNLALSQAKTLRTAAVALGVISTFSAAALRSDFTGYVAIGSIILIGTTQVLVSAAENSLAAIDAVRKQHKL